MKLISVLMLSALALSSAVHAEGRWYTTVAGGQSSFDISKSDLENTALDYYGLTRQDVVDFGLSSSSSLDDTDTAYKIQVGYQFNEYFAIEGGYINLGETTYKGGLTDGVDYTDAHFNAEVDGFNLGLVGSLPVGKAFSLFGTVGAINAKVETKIKFPNSFSSEESFSEDSTDVKPYYGLGAAYSLTDAVAMRLDYTFFDNLGDDKKTGEADVDFVSLGLTYSF